MVRQGGGVGGSGKEKGVKPNVLFIYNSNVTGGIISSTSIGFGDR